MKVLIIGGVAGGAGTAARLRRNDEHAQIILFEKGEHISFANCGLPYYIGGVITEKEALLLQTPESFHARFRVDVRVQSEVLSVDTAAKTVLVKNHVTGETYSEDYDKLVLSPGAKPISPPMPGRELNHVFTLRNIPDTYAIRDYVETAKPRTCAVIGAGFIGLEMAENLVHAGVSVSVVEAAAHVMAPIDPDTAHEVHNYIREKGVKLYIGRKCVEMGAGFVLLDDGSRVDADMVLLSIGVAPETAFLKGSGVELGARGELLVNAYMETNVPGVYALGDAVSVKNIVNGNRMVIPLASPANKQGRIVGDNLCGGQVAYAGSQGTSIMKFFEMTVAVTGEKEESLQRLGIPYQKSFTYSSSRASYYPGGEMMSIKLLFAPQGGRVLGAQIVGFDGVDKRIESLANAVRFGLTVYGLQEMELAYAPPFSSAKDPVNMAGYVAGNILDGKMIPVFNEDLGTLPADVQCIDVRTTEEYKRGSVDGFGNIPLDSLRERLDEIDLNRPICVTCQIGLRGYLAQRILVQRGAKQVVNLAGGYRLWNAARLDGLGCAAGYKRCESCGKEL